MTNETDSLLIVDSLEVTLSAGRASQALLAGIDLDLQPGQLLAIIGPNGAGKTSLLRTICGELAIAKGSIRVCNQPLPALTLRERARRIAVLPQLSGLNFPFSVEEVIALGRSPHDTGRDRDRAIVAQAMAEVDVLHLRDRLYTHLSGGEKQRVQLARVLAQVWPVDSQPRLLLLDEPLSALDLGHQQLLMRSLQTFCGRGLGVIMAVHDVNIASAYADRLLALKGGRCVAAGSAHAVVSAPVLKELFGVTMQILPRPGSGKPMAVGV
ncbi:heme ABC transporter ATP-binding protein [Proteobacteria bacterium 005FR1]|nr:heme ABC transporter ATP-binding protein [Proteobacteria bacterium 005FR1]